jgi:hypothetical protein
VQPKPLDIAVDFDPYDPLENPDDLSPEEASKVRGLPRDWAAAATQPIRIALPKPGWRKLLWRYAGMGPSRLEDVLKQIGRHGTTFPPTCVLLESDYIDADYRDEYSHFYSRVYRKLPSRCERLHFFAEHGGEERYLGYMVLRPVLGRPICRTMLRPPEAVEPHVSCVASSSATPYGYPLRVRGFPYISQDSQFGTCSHAAIWMVGLYFHLRFRRRRFYMSDVIAAARRHQDEYPAIPANGLTLRQVIAVLTDLDMAPLAYKSGDLPGHDGLTTIVCRYLNSGLPVVVLAPGGASGHARVLIGYRRDDDGRLLFILHDDQQQPYVETVRLGTPPEYENGAAGTGEVPSGELADTDAEHGPWDALVIPMPGKIYLSGEAAEMTGRLVFDEAIDELEGLAHLRGGLADGRLRLRSYVTEIAAYKQQLRARGLPHEVVRWHVNVSGSHWLWVIELQDRELARRGPDCVLGEIALDATSDDQATNPLFGNLPGRLMRWPELGEDMEIADLAVDTPPYQSGCALHVWS